MTFGTGRALEMAVIPSLELGGYAHHEQVNVGKRITGGTHKVDIVAFRRNETYLISLKWQQVGGTADEKVPYEVLCLKSAVQDSAGAFCRAYLVLGGPAWPKRNFYTSDTFEQLLPHNDAVTILPLEDFMALANSGKL